MNAVIKSFIWKATVAGKIWSMKGYRNRLKPQPNSVLPLRTREKFWRRSWYRPRILYAKHGCAITGKSFIVSFRFVEYHKRWIKTEVLFLFMFRIELLFVFSFITCHSRILLRVKFKNFCSFAVCSVLFFFHNLCPEYSWIPLGLSLLRLFSVVCLRLYILTEKVSLSKKWKSSPLF